MATQGHKLRQPAVDDSGVDNNEETPLLSISHSETDLEVLKNDATESYVYVAKGEAKWIATSSSLTVITLVLESSFYFVNVIAVSHLGTKELAAMALSITLQAVIATAPTFGLLSAMDTFCSTAYTASRDKTLVGFHFQRGIIAVCVHFVLVLPILWNSEWLLLQIGQDPDVARLAGIFLRIHILSIVPFAIFEATKRYLQAQEIMRAGTIITVIVAPIHWLGNFILVRSPTYGMGFIGAPIVNLISNCLLLIGIAIYAYNSRAIETWGGWTISAFYNMTAYYRLAIPSVITVCAGWICFELLTLGASYFGTAQLAGQTIIFNAIVQVYQFSNGLGYSTSPRVGNLIGAARPRQARIASDMAILTSLVIVMSGTLFLALCGDWWILVYTDDPAVNREAAKLIPSACIFIIGDGLNAISSAILRGLGRQKASANSFLFGFYIFAVPLAIYLGYTRNLETAGLWWGTCAGVLLSSILQLTYIYWLINWKDEVRLCLLRLKSSGHDSQETLVQ